ncbi:MAG TPA: glycerol-3-phosphate dehydrogenase [Chitinophagaceae bacterium]|jgi:glycerol-3-phosphate dehydrogenase (NAD(P)+)|nr:glycerol-3-phosphate dehydrogenase [Chitinophagaceae bacterium]
MRFGMIGSGSWGTALVKILTDNHQSLNWWIRNPLILDHLKKKSHNPNYLSSVYFDPGRLHLTSDLEKLIRESACLVIAVPSAYIEQLFDGLPSGIFKGKRVLSAVKGILPGNNLLLNDWLRKVFHLEADQYFTVMGPCHAEEIAAEKLSYLTFSGLSETATREMASYFETDYLNTITNNDIYGVQYAAVLKNIYALGAGMAHGLEYGDNFLSVFIANCADEMAGFLLKAGISHIEVGIHSAAGSVHEKKSANYAASVYLGDLLVTCYSLFSRNRTFGNMIGKGYTVHAAKLELNMVAEGYNASQCLYRINEQLKAEMPIADTIYRILWQNVNVREGFKQLEGFLV